MSGADKSDTVILSCGAVLMCRGKYMKENKTVCSAIEIKKKRISDVFKNVTIVYYRLRVRSQIADQIFQ